MPRKLFEKEKTLQVHLTKWAHQGVFSWWLIFGKFEGSKFLLKKEIGINTYVLKNFETSETSFFLSWYYIETTSFFIFMYKWLCIRGLRLFFGLKIYERKNACLNFLWGLRRKKGATTTPLLSAECQKADCYMFILRATRSLRFFHKATFGLHFGLH